MSESPKSWELSSIGELCEPSQYGWTTKASLTSTTSIKILRTTDISGDKINWETVPYCSEVPDDLSRYLLRPNDIVISRAGSIGLSALITNPDDAVFASYLIRFVPRPEMKAKYLGYFLKSPDYWNAVRECASGIALQNVNAKKLSVIEVPVAPFPEQSRIVAEIEKQFTRLDAATAALKRVQANLKRYRASVLKAACEGRLVSTAIGTETYSKIPVIELLAQPLANGRSPAGAREGFKILRLTALQDGGIDMKEWRRGPVSESWIENLSIKQGDILVSRGNGSKALVGLAGLVGDTSAESEPILFPDTMIRIRLNKELCDARFFVLIWNSRIMRDQIESTARTTAGIHKIAQSDIERFEIPLPSLDVQLSIAAIAEKAFTTLRHTAQALEKLAIRSSSMRASILSSAFTGQLVPQDPTDEPATALLERIRAERQLKDSSKRNGRAAPPHRRKGHDETAG